VLNGQIVPPLSQWQGAVLIAVAIVATYVVHRLRYRRGL
jgi:hypothetical protein